MRIELVEPLVATTLDQLGHVINDTIFEVGTMDVMDEDYVTLDGDPRKFKLSSNFFRILSPLEQLAEIVDSDVEQPSQ